MLGIERDVARPRGQRNVDRFPPAVDVQIHAQTLPRRHDLESHRNPEDGRDIIRVLNLLHGEEKALRRLVPEAAHAKLRMAAAVRPLTEKPTEVPTRLVLEGAP